MVASILFYAVFVLLLVLEVLTFVNKKISKKTIPVMLLLSVCMAVGYAIKPAGNSSAGNEEDTSVRLIADKYEGILEDVLEKSYGSNFSLHRNGLVFEIRAWNAGLQQCVELAQNGEQEYVDEWNGIVTGIADVCKQYSDLMSEQNAGTFVLMWSLVDEDNADSFLCTAVNGVTVYNAVEAQA